MKMKLLLLPATGAIIYVLLFRLCQAVGSKLFDFSGEPKPLDGLFEALLEPSMIVYSLLPEPPNNRLGEMLFFLPSLLFYAIAFGLIIELLTRAIRIKTTTSS